MVDWKFPLRQVMADDTKDLISRHYRLMAEICDSMGGDNWTELAQLCRKAANTWETYCHLNEQISALMDAPATEGTA